MKKRITNQRQRIQVHRLEENLASLRKIAGLTLETLGSVMGTSRQAVSRFERGQTEMSVAQYVCIRHLLDYYSSKHPENVALQRMMFLLLDDLTIVGHGYVQLQQTAEAIAAVASSGFSEASFQKAAQIMIDQAEAQARKSSVELMNNPLVREKLCDEFGINIENASSDWTAQLIMNAEEMEDEQQM